MWAGRRAPIPTRWPKGLPSRGAFQDRLISGGKTDCEQGLPRLSAHQRDNAVLGARGFYGWGAGCGLL